MIFSIFRGKRDAVKLHQRPQLIYRLDEVALKLTCSTVNQKLLAAEGSKQISTATHWEREETVRVVVETIGYP
jgi:hypothetical protein